ncbi:hypothetical protein SAY86_003999 [Trapa natans]|uniref:Alcohol dehydrogenase-like N-terminal domain-containing protein n=1 Tax=Trapa natans TaxID=22666 RepID=A0AAN7RHJ4_TRANT|nr:hypothetical protein SAY86_003999 [Trapa natans]
MRVSDQLFRVSDATTFYLQQQVITVWCHDQTRTRDMSLLRLRAAWEAGKPLVIEEVEVAPPQANEVRLKILFTALCHTDVYFWEAKGQSPIFPGIFPHYAGGYIVESVGEGVTHMQPGDRALPVFTGECPYCQSEESNMCHHLRINTERGVMLNYKQSIFSIIWKPINHFVGTSTFSEYTVVHAGCVAKINPETPLEKVCMLGCGISTGVQCSAMFIAVQELELEKFITLFRHQQGIRVYAAG